MPRRFLIWAAVCVVWWAGLVWALEPLAARASLRKHGPDAAIDAPPPSAHDFYRTNEAVQSDAVLRQRRIVASGYVEDAEERLNLFQALAVFPPCVGFLMTALIGWLPESEQPRPRPSARPQRWRDGRRVE